MRAFGLSAFGVLVALVIAVSGASASAGQVNCPIKSGPPTGGDVQWAFHVSGQPASSSYVHGRGSWTSGRATGTVCASGPVTRKGGARDLVLAVAGKSKLTGRVSQGGLLGVRLVLPVKVRASDDKACTKGATGTITLFASYYSIHRDTMKVHFGAHCTGHNLSYSGSAMVVYIARHGAQVNTP